MTAKSFCYACVGIFMLVAAWTMGARYAKADFDPAVPGLVVGGAWNGMYFTHSGEVWQMNISNGGWIRQPERDLPVPVSQLKFYNGDVLMTTSDVGWRWAAGQWRNEGVFPGATVSVAPSTMSDLKSRYRKEDD